MFCHAWFACDFIVIKVRESTSCDGKIKKLKAKKSLPNIVNEEYIVQKNEINWDVCSVKLLVSCANLWKYQRQLWPMTETWEGLVTLPINLFISCWNGANVLGKYIIFALVHDLQSSRLRFRNLSYTIIYLVFCHSTNTFSDFQTYKNNLIISN